MWATWMAMALQATMATPVADTGGAPEQVSVCSLHADLERHVGQRVRLEAEYATDSAHWSRFKDPACPRDILDQGRNLPTREASVDAFDKALKAYCAAKRSPSTCVVAVPMRVRGVIRMASGAHLQPDARYPVIDLEAIDAWVLPDGQGQGAETLRATKKPEP